LREPRIVHVDAAAASVDGAGITQSAIARSAIGAGIGGA
jgi:hypothetical protein